MVCNEATHKAVDLGNVAQIPRTVELMQSGAHQVWRIAHVMEPGCAHQSFGLIANQMSDGFGPTPHALTVRPATRQRLGQQKARKVPRTFSRLHVDRLANALGARVSAGSTCRPPRQG
ncbi:hypothetical protein Asi02nite_42470 [Asanoa siamensis]|uniref:Uncharacterized protein n=1 Tax=Asanoa siamensis TaxID=926357 RepID=A0ABQ4CTX2_9ACTN|nr:hypothetical protein Asi02nite_42470 [Asanoa siamensis]